MFEKLKALRERFLELDKLIADNDIIANQEEWQKLVKERASVCFEAMESNTSGTPIWLRESS